MRLARNNKRRGLRPASGRARAAPTYAVLRDQVGDSPIVRVRVTSTDQPVALRAREHYCCEAHWLVEQGEAVCHVRELHVCEGYFGENLLLPTGTERHDLWCRQRQTGLDLTVLAGIEPPFSRYGPLKALLICGVRTLPAIVHAVIGRGSISHSGGIQHTTCESTLTQSSCV